MAQGVELSVHMGVKLMFSRGALVIKVALRYSKYFVCIILFLFDVCSRHRCQHFTSARLVIFKIKLLFGRAPFRAK